MKKLVAACLDNFLGEDNVFRLTAMINYDDKVVQYSRAVDTTETINDETFGGGNIDYEYDVVELDKKTKKLRRYKAILVSEKDVDEAFVKSYEKYYEVVDTNKLETTPLTKLEEEVEE